jgi:hypothetical protein
MRSVITLGTLLLVLCLLAGACQTMSDARKDFTEKEVAEIKALVEGFDPKVYRVVLPTFTERKIVGAETKGALPVTEVRKVASLLNVRYSENANLQAVFTSCNGGGPGSHTESQSAGTDVGRRIERILQNIDRSRYILFTN